MPLAVVVGKPTSIGLMRRGEGGGGWMSVSSISTILDLSLSLRSHIVICSH